jgi:hypothetical protein
MWNTGLLTNHVTILVAAVVVSTTIFDLLVKRTNLTRFLLGMRLKKKPAEAPAQRPEETAS